MLASRSTRLFSELAVAAALGFGAGFIGSMPLAGPVAVLILDRAFRGARRSARLIAYGAALAESIYALAVGVGLPLLLAIWPSLLTVTRAAGAVLLGCVGLVLLFRPSLISGSEPQRRGGDFVTGLATAGFNPTLFASWTAVTSALYGEGWLAPVPGTAPLLALGVGLGVVSWFLLVIRFASRFGERMNAARRRNLVRGFGVFLLGIALYVGARMLYGGPPGVVPPAVSRLCPGAPGAPAAPRRASGSRCARS